MMILSSSRFEEHVPPPGHPERPERAAVLTAVAQAWTGRGGAITEPRAATREELVRVHTAMHVERMAATAGKASMLDPDTFASPETYEVALLATGATVQAAQHARDTGEISFALVRPPGHHAEADKAMGFCLFNSVAVAAADALAGGLTQVAVVDIDVHHGNGTQRIFYHDPRVLYISSHQFPFYPGTGAAGETGDGPGAGFTVNIPLEAGATDDDYGLVYRAIAIPILKQFAPQLTLVSAGYDAHEADPLAAMRMTAAGYARILSLLKSSALETGALALVTEGGYDLPALRECLEASLSILAGKQSNSGDSGTSAIQRPRRGERAVAEVRAAQAPFWPSL